MTEEKLTTAQKRVYQAIVDHLSVHRYPPTTRELGAAINLKAPSIHEQLKRLARKGYIKLQPGLARGIELVDLKSNSGIIKKTTVRPIPLLHNIDDSRPVMSSEHMEREILMDTAIIGNDKLFALKMTDNSMKDANIDNGDIILIRQQTMAENGDIVAALVDNTTTIKRLRVTAKKVLLTADNRDQKPLNVTNNESFRILGKVVRTLRQDKNIF